MPKRKFGKRRPTGTSRHDEDQVRESPRLGYWGTWQHQLADVYDERWPSQVSIADRYLYGRSRAEDAVQDTYSHLLDHPQQNMEIGGAYVDACVRNHCLHVLARDKRRREDLSALALILQIDVEGAEIDAEGEGVDSHAGHIRWLNGKLRRLAPMQKHVLKLELKGKTSNEIAQLLGVSPSTVRSHRSAAIAKLQAIAESEKDGAPDSGQPRRPPPLVRRTPRRKRGT